MNPSNLQDSVSIVVIGAGAQGRVSAATLQAAGRHIIGFFDDNPTLHNTRICDIPVLGGISTLLSPVAEIRTQTEAFIGVGSNPARRQIAESLRAAGVTLTNAIHPSAVLAATTNMGTGIFIGPGAIVVTGCTLENDTVINSSVSLDHDSTIEYGAYLAPGVCTAGKVAIGRNAFIGVGSVLGPGVRIGEQTVIGAGSLVLSDIPPGVIAYGKPAQVRRKLNDAEDWQKILIGR